MVRRYHNRYFIMICIISIYKYFLWKGNLLYQSCISAQNKLFQFKKSILNHSMYECSSVIYLENHYMLPSNRNFIWFVCYVWRYCFFLLFSKISVFFRKMHVCYISCLFIKVSDLNTCSWKLQKYILAERGILSVFIWKKEWIYTEAFFTNNCMMNFTVNDLTIQNGVQ
jgi:hypothetical protein